MSYRSDKLYNLGKSRINSINSTSFGPQNTNILTSNMDRETSPEFLAAPLMQQQSLQTIGRKKSSFSRNILGPKLQKRVSIKDVFQNRTLQNLSLDELPKHGGYHVYYLIFKKILLLLMILGLWAPKRGGWGYWCLRNIYPIFIYFVILYPWTTFLTQEAYWSIPVFLFINLHLSGIFAYRSARKYWKENHLVTFLTSTFIPFYDDITEFERRHKKSVQNMNDRMNDTNSMIHINNTDNNDIWDSPQKTLKMGFQQRYKKDNRKRKRMAKKRYHHYSNTKKAKNKRKKHIKIDNNDNNEYAEPETFDLHESLKKIRKNTSDPFKQKEENITSWANIAGSENKLSLSLFYEATQRMWWRFWGLSFLTALPIIAILLIEITSPKLHSSISTHSSFKSSIFTDIFIPFNTIITFVRIFYNICEFVFMAFYFQFICECHRGDLLIHLHYYDTSDINISESSYKSLIKYYQELEFRLASIAWDWDRIASSIRNTSKAFRWWVFVMIVFNFIAGVTAIVNLTTNSLDAFPQHLEMYLPAVVNIIVSFYVLLTGSKVAHLNKTVSRRTYFLLATTHFADIEVTSSNDGNNNNNNNNNNNDDLSITNYCVSNRSPMLKGVAINIEDEDDDDVDYEHSVNDIDDGGNDNNINTKDIVEPIQSNIGKMELEIKKQNLYIQAQTVARAATTREIGISIYGLVLNRNLFLAFFSPFVAFFLFCINTWLPN